MARLLGRSHRQARLLPIRPAGGGVCARATSLALRRSARLGGGGRHAVGMVLACTSPARWSCAGAARRGAYKPPCGLLPADRCHDAPVAHGAAHGVRAGRDAEGGAMTPTTTGCRPPLPPRLVRRDAVAATAGVDIVTSRLLYHARRQRMRSM